MRPHGDIHSEGDRQLTSTLTSAMRFLHAAGLLVMALTVGGCRHTSITSAQTKEPIISVEERSRMFRVISPKTGKVLTPGVDIFADGRCLVRAFDGEELERSLRSSDVTALLDFFDRQGLFAISDESIERAIDRDLKRPVEITLEDGSVCAVNRYRITVVDASDTRLIVRAPGKEVRISRYALHCELEEYRTVTELKAVQRCVERVYELAGTRP